MLFTSYEFIGFVALLLVLYYLIPKRFQWMLLLVASYVFYILADPMYLPYILVTTFTTYAAALIMQKDADKTSDYLKLHKEDMEKDARKAYKAARKKVRARIMTLCILINVGILMFVKYVNFIIGNVNSVLQVGDPAGQFALLDVIVPMGISFYTFMALSYIIDVYRGTVRAESNPGKLALFITFFPHIVQGPISRYGDLSVTLFEEHAFDKTKVSFGLQRIMWGFFKKLVVADRIMPAVTTVIGDTEGGHRGMYALVCVIFYTIELYADFTGGIDITIGIAEALGITVKENFERPYFSMSLKEYWRRWHITMCSWFRDYIFYPVSGSKWLQKFTKFSRKTFGEKVGRRLPVYISSFIVWFTTGLWHGASWNFIVWGLLNYLVLMISEEFEPLYDRFHNRFKWSNTRAYDLFRILRTFLLICVLNLFDCFEHVGDTFKMLASIFTVHNWNELAEGGLLNIGMSGLDYLIILLAVIVMITVSLIQRKESVRVQIAALKYPVRVLIWFGLFLCILLVGAYGIGYDSSQFIYNRF